MNELRIEELPILIRAHRKWRTQSIRDIKYTQKMLAGATERKAEAAALLKKYQDHPHNHVKRVAQYTNQVMGCEAEIVRYGREKVDSEYFAALHTSRIEIYTAELKEVKAALKKARVK